MVISFRSDQVISCDRMYGDAAVLVGGGHGGKRANTGRKAGKSSPLTNVDWKKYRKMSKKEINNLSKTNKSIHDFFVKGPATREAAEHDEARESFAKTNDDVTEVVRDFLSNTKCDLTKEKEMNVEAGDDTSNLKSGNYLINLKMRLILVTGRRKLIVTSIKFSQRT